MEFPSTDQPRVGLFLFMLHENTQRADAVHNHASMADGQNKVVSMNDTTTTVNFGSRIKRVSRHTEKLFLISTKALYIINCYFQEHGRNDQSISVKG